MGGRGSSGKKYGGGQKISGGLQKHFDAENKKLEEFLNSNDYDHGYKSVQMDNGQIIESYNAEGLKKHVKDLRSDMGDYVDEDTSIWVEYKNGTKRIFGSGDSTKGLNSTGIKNYIENNANTTVVYGKGVKVVNYNQKYAKQKWTDYGINKYSDDWRAE